MMQFPIWVWVVAVLGVIAAGIGLGYLIIYLFWKIERYISSQVAIRKDIQPEEKIEEPSEQQEPVEEQVVEEESIELMDREVKEEITPIVAEVIPGEYNRLIKFTTILHSKFNHPFQKANTIVCWDLALENGEEVRDTEGKSMKLQVIKPQSEAEHTRYILVDEAGQQTISVIHGKEYVKRETNLDFDKMTK